MDIHFPVPRVVEAQVHRVAYWVGARGAVPTRHRHVVQARLQPGQLGGVVAPVVTPVVGHALSALLVNGGAIGIVELWVGEDPALALLLAFDHCWNGFPGGVSGRLVVNRRAVVLVREKVLPSPR